MKLPRVRHWAPLLVLLAAGCGRDVPQAEVSGTVTYRGKPLPGGVVTFITDRGLSGTATIGADGGYRLLAPVGDVKVSVDNRMLRKVRSAGYRISNRPEGEGLQPLTGTYVPVPEKYASAETSGLTRHVDREAQTFDIRLE
jgi:hypothetical protein